MLTTLDLASSSVVLRRAIADDMPAIVRLMTCLAEADFPVPRVYDFSGPDLVMERLDGRDRLADLSSRPWLVGQHAATLAELHDQLHAIVGPPSLLAQFGPASRMRHLDLHPGNVMLTAAGPVVIDWSNVAAGAPAADVAMAWLIMATSEIGAIAPGAARSPTSLAAGSGPSRALRQASSSCSPPPSSGRPAGSS